MGNSPLYSSPSSVGSSGDAAAAALMFGVLGFVVILSYIIGAVFMGMIFKKAGIPAWKAWVPVYNSWVFLELGGQKGWWILLALIPFLNYITGIVAFVFLCIAAYRIGLNFGKEAWFVVLYILAGPVWLIWLAVDKTAVWQPLVAGAIPNTNYPPVAPPTQQPASFTPTAAPQTTPTPTQETPSSDSTNNPQ
jgi:hypothetical protein